MRYPGAEPIVQLFIVSRDRRDFCREAVASAMAQRYHRCEVIVSDNSSGEDVSKMLAEEFPQVTVIRRQPNLTALDHFNHLIEESQAPLMVMFHDDDVLEPDYAERMVEFFCQHPDVAAVGCNAHIIRGIQRTQEISMGSFKGIQLLKNPCDLLDPYLTLSLTDPAPFPGYMYRTAFIKGLKLDSRQGGKHSDVSFLLGVLTRGPILWTADCLFNYRIHDTNDSRKESIPDRLKWLRHIQKVTGMGRRSKAIIDYKFIYWRRWILQNSDLEGRESTSTTSTRHRYAVVRHFVISQTLRMAFTRKDFWLRTWRSLMRPRVDSKEKRR